MRCLLRLDLLRSYRIAHARVSAIEPFETSLRENTPLASINDPGALVEYLNQLNLKGDMVLNELKRVSSERDSFKQRLDVAEKDAKEAWDSVTELRERQVTSGKIDKNLSDDQSHFPSESQQNHLNLAKSPIIEAPQIDPESLLAPAEPRISVASDAPLFSPKKTPAHPPKMNEEAEEFFSYDNELPRLENELNAKQDEIMELQDQVKHLKDDLAVARESAQSMVKTLEDSTREVSLLKDRREGYEADLQEHKSTSDAIISALKADLEIAQGKFRKIEATYNAQSNAKILDLEQRLSDASLELENMQQLRAGKSEVDAVVASLQSDVNSLKADLSILQTQKDQSQKRVDTLNGLVTNLREQLSFTEQDGQRLKTELAENSEMVNDLQKRVMQAEQKGMVQENTIIGSNSATINDKLASLESTTANDTDSKIAGDANITTKKRNKKKKKGGKPIVEQESPAHPDSPKSDQITTSSTDRNGATVQTEQSNIVKILQGELDSLHELLSEKDAAIERLDRKLKDEEILKEEIDSLREELLEIGQEHVIAKDKIKELVTEKTTLQTTASSLEKEIAELRAGHLSQTADSDRSQKDLTAQFEDLKVKAANMQIDLSAAQQLASSRFKEITDMRTILQRAQPELVSLRKEATEFKGVREELDAKVINLQRIEARQEIMRTELESTRKALTDKDSEVKILNLRLSQETNARLSIEEANSSVRQELQQSETEKRLAKQSLEKLSKDLSRSRDELSASKARVRELDESISKLNQEGESHREEIDLKTAQHASAESLMSSMRDQSTEMAMQAKEARERCESLEEEVADAHRLLSERSREAETMRRLLAEVEGRTDSRLREMRERMDAAVEERDRAEDEASTIGRRRTRELEELRMKLKDADRDLKRSEEDKESLENAQRDWKRRREELEQRTEQSSREAEEVKKAMSELRDALDESERQASDLEKQKVELRRTVEEMNHRLDKLQRSNKVSSKRLTTHLKLTINT